MARRGTGFAGLAFVAAVLAACAMSGPAPYGPPGSMTGPPSEGPPGKARARHPSPPVASPPPSSPRAATVAAAALRLRCFGNEPSWGIDLVAGEGATLAFPGEEPARLRGSESLDVARGVRVWRGSADAGAGDGDLVLYLAASACSDGMSDTVHPVTAHASLPDGRLLSGCCRLPDDRQASAARPAIEGVAWRLVGAPSIDTATLDGLALRAPTLVFEGGRVSGSTGCNQLTGGYSLAGERLRLGALALTRKACLEPAVQQVESAFVRVFGGELAVAVDDDRLTLRSSGGVALEFAAVPAP